MQVPSLYRSTVCILGHPGTHRSFTGKLPQHTHVHARIQYSLKGIPTWLGYRHEPQSAPQHLQEQRRGAREEHTKLPRFSSWVQPLVSGILTDLEHWTEQVINLCFIHSGVISNACAYQRGSVGACAFSLTCWCTCLLAWAETGF